MKLLITSLFLIAVVAGVSWGQTMKCFYGERGSLKSTCVNATSNFFKATTYRFDSLDETVECVTCNLETVEAGSFDLSGNHILNLDLRRSRIVTLRDSSFVGLVYMKNLYLQDNLIKLVYPGTFRGVKNLENLQMANNSIGTLHGHGFKELVNLTVLNLSRNKVKSLDEDSFIGLWSLKELDLSYNQINELGSALNLTNLLKLDLSNNLITGVKSADFANLTNLVELSLQNNNIKSLQGNSFNIRTLAKLNVSSNGLKFVDPAAFRSLRSLESLDLSNNTIVAINKGTFLGLLELRDLDLSKNLLLTIRTGLFTGLPELRTLNLSQNQIRHVEKTGVAKIPSLHTLDLSNNNLTAIDFKLLYHSMPHLTYFALNGNDWPCYLVSDMDTFFLEDNIKLSIDGLLKNDSCRDIPEWKNEAQLAQIVAEDDDKPNTHAASSFVVYPLIILILLGQGAMFYILYKSDRFSKLGAGNSRSQAQLMSHDGMNEHDGGEY